MSANCHTVSVNSSPKQESITVLDKCSLFIDMWKIKIYNGNI